MIHRGGEFVKKKKKKNSIMMCMSIINAHDSVAYNVLNNIQPNNDKINNLVLPYTETHERRFVFSCKPAHAVHV